MKTRTVTLNISPTINHRRAKQCLSFIGGATTNAADTRRQYVLQASLRALLSKRSKAIYGNLKYFKIFRAFNAAFYHSLMPTTHRCHDQYREYIMAIYTYWEKDEITGKRHEMASAFLIFSIDKSVEKKRYIRITISYLRMLHRHYNH